MSWRNELQKNRFRPERTLNLTLNRHSHIYYNIYKILPLNRFTQRKDGPYPGHTHDASILAIFSCVISVLPIPSVETWPIGRHLGTTKNPYPHHVLSNTSIVPIWNPRNRVNTHLHWKHDFQYCLLFFSVVSHSKIDQTSWYDQSLHKLLILKKSKCCNEWFPRKSTITNNPYACAIEG